MPATIITRDGNGRMNPSTDDILRNLEAVATFVQNLEGGTPNQAIARNGLSTAAGTKTESVQSPTIATTGNTDVLLVVPETGTLAAAYFTSVAALAASDTNYITFTITNLGQAGSGTTVMLAAAGNSTQVTGGTALTAAALRTRSLSGTPANLAVTQGDVLRIRAAATGTLAGAVTVPSYELRFTGTN